MPDVPTGWLCPRCDTVNAPMLLKCSCSPTPLETRPTEPDMLAKFAKLAEEMNRDAEEVRRARHVPLYPVPLLDWTYRPYLGPQYTWTATTSDKLIAGDPVGSYSSASMSGLLDGAFIHTTTAGDLKVRVAP